LVTERGLPLADGASACPFVAFEDDRDERASVPDRRHRCYAESRPAPRALAHQEAYCLSSAFPVCPTFQDWARREAARARDAADAAAALPGGRAAATSAGAAESGGKGAAAGVAAAGAAAAGASALAGSGDPGDDDDAPGDPAPAAASTASTAPAETDADSDPVDPDGPGARRNPPRDWAAPPPWLASSEGGGSRPAAGTPPFLGHRTPEPGQGLAGSAADWLAGGEAPAAGLGATAGASTAGAGAAVGRGRSDSIEHQSQTDGDQADRAVGDEPPRRPARRSRAYEQHLGGTDGPDWERPRRYEAYPTIKTRVGMPNLSRPALMIGAIAIAAIALFFLPALLGIGGTGSPAGPSLAPSGAAASQSLLPTQVPAPTPVLYTIKKNDILSKIASAHGVSLADLLAANPQIKNPNRITEGQVITIPVPSGGPDQGGGSAQPSPSAS
jgi:hypothetical protein